MAVRIIHLLVLVFFLGLNTSAQNIGINQPNPIWPLDMSASHCLARLITTSSTYGSVLELRNTNGSAEYLAAINFNNPSNTFPGQIAYRADHRITFRANGQERMCVDMNGQLGIGTLTPEYDVHVYRDHAWIKVVTTNSTTGSILELENVNPFATSLGAINFGGGNGGGQISYSADHQMIFHRDGFERLRLNATGAGIARAAVTNRLEVEGNASKSSAGDWVANSDARLKKNIKQLDSQEMLEKLLSLEGVTYEWNDDKTGSMRPEGIQYGFIAQDIKEVFPTLVEEDNLGYYQTAYGTYDPMMVEAIRALNERITALQSENALLKEEIISVRRLIQSPGSSQ